MTTSARAATALLLFAVPLAGQAAAPAPQTPATIEVAGLRWRLAAERRNAADSTAAFWTLAERATACPAGWRLPTREEWVALFATMGGAPNPRGGFQLSRLEPWDARYGLALGGALRNGRPAAAGVMGFYWSATDSTMNGATRAVAAHIYTTGGGLQVEPTYLPPTSDLMLPAKCVQPVTPAP